jgi:2-polyprenyl-6-hydroxyphenyl methylase/3-demethylubiquinone-9 3-methyltransferase
MLGRDRIEGKTFLDVGSGSGLFSLAAMRLGARRVHSFDLDDDSVACAAELQRRYFSDDARWTIGQGSALDADYLARLGEWDVVYAWGVLHHTGEMWRALDLVARSVAADGRLLVALYNDQGRRSEIWRSIKRQYNRSALGKAAVLTAFVPYYVLRGVAVDLVVRQKNPLRRYREYAGMRGMSAFHDWKDWLGGYPFEVARPDEVEKFLGARGFSSLKSLTEGRGHGCNEFVVVRTSRPGAAPLSMF